MGLKFKHLTLLFCLLSLFACTGIEDEEESISCGTNESINPETKECVSNTILYPNDPHTPANTTSTATAVEGVPTVIILNYSDANNDPAYACSVIGSQVSGCSCAAGTCSTVFTATSSGTFTFTYQVTDSSSYNLTSPSSTVTVTVTGADQAPVNGVATTPTTLVEDTTTTVTLSYSDPDGELATACEVTQEVNISEITTCSCSSGVCTAGLRGTTNYNGAASFLYRVKANNVWSKKTPVNLTISAAADSAIGVTTSASTSEDTSVTITLDYLDGDGDEATACATQTLNNVTVSSACACSSGVCTVGITPDSNEHDSSNTGSTGFSFEYAINDGTGLGSYQTLTLSVSAVNDIPTLTTVSDLTAAEDTALTITYTALAALADEADTADSDTLSFRVEAVSSGTLTKSGVAVTAGTTTLATGESWVWTPASNVNGNDVAAFTVKAYDGTDVSATAIQVNADISAVDDDPTVSSISDVSTVFNTPITVGSITADEGGGTDEDTQTPTVSVASSDTGVVPLANIDIAVEGVSVGNASAARSIGDGANSTDTGSYTISLNILPDSGLTTVDDTTLTVTIDDGTNTVDETFVVTVYPVSATHNDWANVKATGTVTDKDGTTVSAASVTLDWNAFTVAGAANITGYKVYRRQTGYVFDFNSPLTTITSASTKTYTDSSVSTATTYYYVVQATQDYNSSLPVGTDNISSAGDYDEIRVIVPPNNMALVHRWIANQTMCQRMGLTPDDDENYRCSYTGPGDIAGPYYDVSADIIIDRVEAGCPYSAYDETNASGCDSTNGCIGTSTPNGSVTAAVKSIFYDRSDGKCYVNTDGATTWSEINNQIDQNQNIEDTILSSYTRLPPMVHVSQENAHKFCVGQDYSLDSGATTGQKRLMRKKDFMVASEYVSTLSDSAIDILETGMNLNSTSRCNSNQASGLNSSYSVTFPSTLDTLPGTSSNAIRSLRTGSTSTASCVSRFGVQDLVGNVREWTSDRIFCNEDDECQSVDSTNNPGSRIDINNNDFESNGLGFAYAFDEQSGPCTDANQDDACDGTSLTSWSLYQSPAVNEATLFNYPMGLPFDTDATSTPTTLSISNTSGAAYITEDQLHNDKIIINANSINAADEVGRMTVGGSYLDGNAAGRFMTEFIDSTAVQDAKTGFRCVFTVN